MNSFISSFLQNRSLLCSCLRDRHARRLSLRDDPESHFKEDCTILFHKNQTLSRYFFLSIYFLKITYLWRTLRRHAKYFLKISLIFIVKIYQEFIKSRTQLSLDLNQLVLYAQNTSDGASFRKTLRCFDTVFRRPQRYFSFALVQIFSCFTFKR